MILSKTYTEEELYVDDIDQSEDNMQCNVCEKVSNLMRHNTNADKKTKQKKSLT